VLARLVGTWALLGACSFAPGTSAGDGAIDFVDGPIDTPGSMLTWRGLVARYFIDESDGNVLPLELVDSAPSPVALPITYTPALTFVELPTGRGLRWSAASDTARASARITGTKLADLAGATTWTYEVVLDVRMPGGQSRIIGINDDVNGYGKASLLTGSAIDLRLHVDPDAASWYGNIDLTRGRTILTAVVDTSLPMDRAKVFVDGALCMLGSDLPANLALVFGANDFLTLGNVSVSGRSFAGDIYYAAIYDVALTETEVAANTALLRVNDDGP